MNMSTLARIRGGALALALGGLLGFVGELMRGPMLDPRTDPAGYAQAAVSPNFSTAWILILLAAAISILGTFALYIYLAAGTQDRLAFPGMVLSVFGGALFLALTGSFAFAAPVIAKLYQGGDQGVMAVAAASFFSGPATGILYPSGLIGTLGSILMGIAMWRSRSIPALAGLLFAIHTPLLAFAPAFSYAAELLGGLSLLVSGAMFAWAAWRTPAAKP